MAGDARSIPACRGRMTNALGLGSSMTKGFSASPAQRLKVEGSPCAYCGGYCGPIDPAHLLPRSMLREGQDDPRAVIPLGRPHHRAYDVEGLDILGCLEPHYREELAFAVKRAGLVTTLRRVTNNRA